MPGVQVERATVRTTWPPGAVSARLCLGRRQTGWESPTTTPHGRHPHTEPPPSRSLSAPAGGILCVPRLPSTLRFFGSAEAFQAQFRQA